MTKKSAPVTNAEASESKDPLIGKQLGDYRLSSVLATGGMARIYKAMDYKLQRHAAVKVLAAEEAENDKTLTKRFQREARAVAALEHDNIITIYQFGEQEGVYFLAMKLVKGKDLAQEFKRLKKVGQKMDIRRGLRILSQVASALDYAHKADVIHRDIKPSNILLDEDDKAILTDFGLVLRNSVETTMGTAFGTPRYIAPEQAISSNKALPQSDIYSLAVIIYEMLVGETPFTGESPMEIALSHISDPVPPPRSKDKSIPEAAERELLRALDKDPEKRHRTATELVRAIQRAYGIDVEGSAQPSPSIHSAESMSSASLLESWSLPSADPAALRTAQDKTRSRRSSMRRILILLILIAAIGGAGLYITRNPAASAPGAPITLIYNDANFTLVNNGDYDLNVFDLLLVRGIEGGGDDFSGDRVRGDTVPARGCFRVVLQTNKGTPPAQCQKIQSVEELTNALRLFWRKDNEGNTPISSFEVRYKGQTLAICDTVARGGDAECRFTWPVPPPTPTVLSSPTS